MQQQTVFWSSEVNSPRWQNTTFHFDLKLFSVVLRPEGDFRLNME